MVYCVLSVITDYMELPCSCSAHKAQVHLNIDHTDHEDANIFTTAQSSSFQA